MSNHDKVPRFPETRRYAAEGPVIDIMWIASPNPTWCIFKNGLAWAIREILPDRVWHAGGAQVGAEPIDVDLIERAFARAI